MAADIFNPMIGLALSARNMHELLGLIERAHSDLPEGSPERRTVDAIARKARRYVETYRAGIEAN
jgi:hypothetical protein